MSSNEEVEKEQKRQPCHATLSWMVTEEPGRDPDADSGRTDTDRSSGSYWDPGLPGTEFCLASALSSLPGQKRQPALPWAHRYRGRDGPGAGLDSGCPSNPSSLS